MPSLPAWCPSCNKAVVPPSAFVVESGGTIDFGDAGGYATCPHCGGTAKVLPGIYTAREGLVDIFSRSQWTQEKLEELHGALRRAQQITEADPEQGLDEIAKVDVVLARHLRTLFRGANNAPGLAQWVYNVMFGIVFLLSQEGELSEGDVERIVDERIDEVIDQRLDEHPSDGASRTLGEPSSSDQRWQQP